MVCLKPGFLRCRGEPAMFMLKEVETHAQIWNERTQRNVSVLLRKQGASAASKLFSGARERPQHPADQCGNDAVKTVFFGIGKTSEQAGDHLPEVHPHTRY